LQLQIARVKGAGRAICGIVVAARLQFLEVVFRLIRIHALTDFPNQPQPNLGSLRLLAVRQANRPATRLSFSSLSFTALVFTTLVFTTLVFTALVFTALVITSLAGVQVPFARYRDFR
jgi:hypothetical protein